MKPGQPHGTNCSMTLNTKAGRIFPDNITRSNFSKWRNVLAMLSVMCGLLASGARAASIASWDFVGQNSGPVSMAATAADSHLTNAPVLTRGAGAAASVANNSFRTAGFKNDGISTANTDYFQTTLTATNGYTLTLSTIDARFSGTQTFVGSGGVSVQWAYSLDGTTFTLIGSPAILTGTVPIIAPSLDLSGVSALQNVPAGTTVYLRLYASGQTTTGGWGFISAATAGTIGLNISGGLNPPAPSAPTVNAASSTNANDFTASWNTASTATGYQLDVATDSGFSSILPAYTSLDVGNVLTTNVSGLTANTDYYYRLRAYNGGGTSGNSATIHVKTLASGIPKITVTLPGEGSANAGGASDQTAGAAFSVTLTATTDGTTVNSGYNGSKSITFSGPTSGASYPANVTFSSGVGTASITLTKAESPTITATDGTIAGRASSVFNVVPGAIDHYVLTAGSAQVIGVPFNVTVTAKDSSGNTVTADSSTSVTMGSGSGNVGFAVNPVTLAAGIAVASASNNVLETTTVTALDGNSKSGVTAGITFNPVPKYRTRQSGNWNDFTTWQVDPGSGFVNAVSGQTPSLLSDTIEIRTGHTVTNTTPVAVDQFTIDVGGQLINNAALAISNGVADVDMDVYGTIVSSASITTVLGATNVFEPGAKYQHNFTSGGTIPFAIWSTGSTCEVTNQVTGTSAPGGLGQAFYNFVWNCPGQTGNINLAGGLSTVNGDFTVISTGTKELRFAANSALLTVNIAGNWSVLGGSNVTSSGSCAPTFNVGGNIVANGVLNLGSGTGATTINASGNLVVGGKLTGGTLTHAFNFAKAGTQTFTNSGTITGAINWAVNDGATLALQNSTLGGTGTFGVSAAGTVAGTGTINGPASIFGVAAPGTATAIGTLTFVNLSQLSGTVIAKADRNGGTPLADEIIFPGGALTYGGTLLFTNIGAPFHMGDTFTLFNASSYSGTFINIIVSGSDTVDATPLTSNGSVVLTSGTTTVTPIPLGSSSSAGTMTFNWSDSSFSLQAATNVAGPYNTVTGATSGFSTNTAAKQMFFRLFHP